jgi:hypothetical protein
MVVAAEPTTAVSADVGVADNVVKLDATVTIPAEGENLEAKSPSTEKTVAPKDNAHPASQLL